MKYLFNSGVHTLLFLIFFLSPSLKSSEIGHHIDRYHFDDELMKYRSTKIPHTDSCPSEVSREARFMGRIEYHVGRSLYMDHVDFPSFIKNIYKLRLIPQEVGLASHRMCNVTRDSLYKTLKFYSRVPSQSTIRLLNDFANKYNRIRDEILENGTQNLPKMKKLWSKFFSCLAYTESLSTADGSKSHSVYRKYGGTGTKPSGVKFYEDPYQSPESRLNIGLFQFTPNKNGNIVPCSRKWNRLFPQCKVPLQASRSTLIKQLASSRQNYNAFCGVDKVLQSFYVQTNTRKPQNTHPDNLTRWGSLLAPARRCISPHFYAGYTYNHFGPLQNSTKTNLDKLMRCTLSEE